MLLGIRLASKRKQVQAAPVDVTPDMDNVQVALLEFITDAVAVISPLRKTAEELDVHS